jgi:hypothetical protein
MRISQLLHPISEASSLDDFTPYEEIEKIKKLIRKGARDPDHNWPNALDLVHQAYKAISVERPVPAAEGAWKQYEDAIQFAVHELNDATHKGIRDDSWKTLSSTIDGTWKK